MPTSDAPNDWSELELLGLMKALLDGWEAARSDGFTSRQGIPVMQAVAVYTVAAHAHQLGRAVIELYKLQLRLEAAPTVRAVYEHALRAMWLAQYQDAAEGFVNEHDRIRKIAFNDAIKAGWDGAEKAAAAMTTYGIGATDSDDSARHFERLCEDLSPGGADAYAVYRVLSMFAHPSPVLTDFYFRATNQLEVSIRPDQRQLPTLWPFMACAGLVWAGRALDMLEVGQPRRAELRRAAGVLRISPELKISGMRALRKARRKD